MEGAPHDAEAIDVEEFTMEGSVQGNFNTVFGEEDSESLEGGWANL